MILNLASAIAATFLALNLFTRATSVDLTPVILGLAFLLFAFTLGWGVVSKKEKNSQTLAFIILILAVYLAGQ